MNLGQAKSRHPILYHVQSLFILKLKAYNFWPASPHFPHSQALVTIILFCSRNLTFFFLDYAYK